MLKFLVGTSTSLGMLKICLGRNRFSSRRRSARLRLRPQWARPRSAKRRL
jgi:hypothetical protein